MKKSCSLPQSAQGGGAGTQIRPSLHHLDAEPCICDVIKVFRQENHGEDFNYQAFFGGGGYRQMERMCECLPSSGVRVVAHACWGCMCMRGPMCTYRAIESIRQIV